MSVNPWTALTLLVAAALGLAATVPGAPTAPRGLAFVHDGDRDPTTEGWSYVGTGALLGILAGGRERTASGEYAYWRAQDLLTDGGLRYTIPLDDAEDLGVWRLTAQLRIVDSPDVPNGLGVGGTGILVGDGRHQWSIYISNTAVGPIDDSIHTIGRHRLARTFPMDTRDDYHLMSIVFSPGGPGDADDSADLWVDDRRIFEDVVRSEIAPRPDKWVYFGPVSKYGTSDAKYAWVCFESQLPPAAAEEPPPGPTHGCGASPSPTLTATPSTSATELASSTPTAFATWTPTATATWTPSVTATWTPTATAPPTTPPCMPGTQASDIALVLDRSSSMEAENKLRAAVDAIHRFVEGARVPPDQLALVTFAGVAGVNQGLVADKAAFRRALDGVLTSRGTRIDLGLKLAREELTGPRRQPDHSAVMVLLSDGVQASGEEGRVASEADAAKAAGILVFTIALGSDADLALLQHIATSPDHAYVAPTAADLAAIYRRIAVAIPCPPTEVPTEPPSASRTAEPSATATPDLGLTADPWGARQLLLPFLARGG